MSDEGSQDARERMRLCPTCRMPISVLATKCRYCGEPVGRPRDETRTLTVDDLGGTSSANYAPSEDVLDALEAFRQEELAAHAHKEEPRRGWFGGRRKREESKTAPAPNEGLPELDARGREVSGLGTGSSSRAPTRRERVWTKKLAIVAGSVAGIVILYFGGLSAKARIDEYFAKKNVKPHVAVENRAVGILNAGGPGLDALKAAMEALAQDNSTENRKVADWARDQVKKDVEALLNATPWSVQKLDQASSLASKASNIDPGSTAIRELKRQVQAENAAYKMTIHDLDAAAGKVTLRFAYPGKPPELLVYYQDDVVKERFRVRRITQNYVTFEDPQRKGAGGLNRYFTISRDGSISIQ